MDLACILSTAVLESLCYGTNMQVLRLHTNVQLKCSVEDTSFPQWLLDVSHGHHIDENGKIDIPPSMVTFNEDILINKIYRDLGKMPLTPPPINYFLDHAILAPQNIDVQDTNEKILQKMQNDEIMCYSADSLENNGEGIGDNIPEDFF